MMLERWRRPIANTNHMQEIQFDFLDAPIRSSKRAASDEQATSGVPTEGVVHAGNLRMLKVAGTKETWIKRWVVLMADSLSYYRDQDVRSFVPSLLAGSCA